MAFNSGKDNFIDFVTNNMQQLLSIRIPLEHITSYLFEKIKNGEIENNAYFNRPVERTTYVGLLLDTIDRVRLFDSINNTCGILQDGHITQQFFGRPSRKRTEPVLLRTLQYPGSICRCHIVAKVTDLKTGQIAFRIREIKDSNGDNVEVHSKNPHITAFVPTGCKASYSAKFVNCDDKDKVIVESLDVWCNTTTQWV